METKEVELQTKPTGILVLSIADLKRAIDYIRRDRVNEIDPDLTTGCFIYNGRLLTRDGNTLRRD